MKTGTYFKHNSHQVDELNIMPNKDREKFIGENENEKIEFYDVFRQNSPACFMKVNTDLMEEEGIFVNDVIVIDPGNDCVNGKIVVVMIDESIIVRRYEKIKSGHMLYGDLKKIAPLKIEGGYNSFKILGTVVYIIKSV